MRNDEIVKYSEWCQIIEIAKKVIKLNNERDIRIVVEKPKIVK